MQERALKARKIFIENPEKSQIDDDLLTWCFDEEDCLWYSILGNYSQYSPEEKRLKQQKYEQEVYELDEKIKNELEKKYESILYESKIRQAVLQRDNYVCQFCGKKGDSSLHIHHILKKNNGGTNHLDNLITTCPSCHKQADTKNYNPDWTK